MRAPICDVGNLTENDQAFLFLMDYANRSRIKLWGRAEFVEGDPDLLARVADPEYHGVPERVLVFHVEAWDINCSQHIKRRFAEDDVAFAVSELQSRIDTPEVENQHLRRQLSLVRGERGSAPGPS